MSVQQCLRSKRMRVEKELKSEVTNKLLVSLKPLLLPVDVHVFVYFLFYINLVFNLPLFLLSKTISEISNFRL